MHVPGTNHATLVRQIWFGWMDGSVFKVFKLAFVFATKRNYIQNVEEPCTEEPNVIMN
jgi:hypothetical protein